MNKNLIKSNQLKTVIFLILLSTCFSSAFSQTDVQIEKIRKIYQEVNQKVTECEANGDTSATFLTEIIVNKNNGSYPAVGIYKTVAKFYYTYGNREKNPYPHRLLKIMLTTNRSSTTETSEFLFNEAEKLIFYFEKKEAERRVYFDLEKPFRILKNEKLLPLNDKTEAEFVKTILNEKKKLVGIFQSSLDF